MALDSAVEAMVEGMELMPPELRIKLLEEIGRLHGMSLTLFALLESQEHKEHECRLSFPKQLVDDYLEAWHKDVYSSMEMSCAANGLAYAPDPNKELRDEILAESDD